MIFIKKIVSEKKSINTFTLIVIIGLITLGIFFIFLKIKGNKKVELFADEDDYIEENEDTQDNNNTYEDFLQKLKNEKVELFDDEDDYIEENEDTQDNNTYEDFLQKLKNRKVELFDDEDDEDFLQGLTNKKDIED